MEERNESTDERVGRVKETFYCVVHMVWCREGRSASLPYEMAGILAPRPPQVCVGALRRREGSK